jgi:hypothetical protein
VQDIYSKSSSCAVVGSAGKLLNQRYGELIDSHDIIIRSNQAPSIGYESHVGSRTDIRILNCHNFSPHFLDSSKNLTTPLELLSFDNDFVLKLKNEHIVVKNNFSVSDGGVKSVFEIMQNNNCKVHLFDDFININKIENLLDIVDSSCGFLGILLAKKLFSSVSCFGFTFHQEEDLSSRHYFEEIKQPNPSSHTFLKEKAIVEFLDLCGFIEFYVCE